MKPCRILLGCMLASLCLLSGGAWAQVVTEFSTGITAGAQPWAITAGPDGNLWFTEISGNRIGRITPLGVVTEFSAGITAGAVPYGITAGPDGNLWFAEYGGNQIWRSTTTRGEVLHADAVSRDRYAQRGRPLRRPGHRPPGNSHFRPRRPVRNSHQRQ